MSGKKEIAEKRIKKLFRLAEEELKKGNLERVRRYLSLAKKIGMKAQYTLPREMKKRICKKCDILLVEGVTCERYLNKDTKTEYFKCFNCNTIKRCNDDKQTGIRSCKSCGKTGER